MTAIPPASGRPRGIQVDHRDAHRRTLADATDQEGRGDDSAIAICGLVIKDFEQTNLRCVRAHVVPMCASIPLAAMITVLRPNSGLF